MDGPHDYTIHGKQNQHVLTKKAQCALRRYMQCRKQVSLLRQSGEARRPIRLAGFKPSTTNLRIRETGGRKSESPFNHPMRPCRNDCPARFMRLCPMELYLSAPLPSFETGGRAGALCFVNEKRHQGSHNCRPNACRSCHSAHIRSALCRRTHFRASRTIGAPFKWRGIKLWKKTINEHRRSLPFGKQPRIWGSRDAKSDEESKKFPACHFPIGTAVIQQGLKARKKGRE